MDEELEVLNGHLHQKGDSTAHNFHYLFNSVSLSSRAPNPVFSFVVNYDFASPHAAAPKFGAVIEVMCAPECRSKFKAWCEM
jgi:hypothetical protein